MSFLLGLTGSIGMGKSTTAQMFRDAGIPVWDADTVVHDLYGSGGAAVAPIRKAFPQAVDEDCVRRPILAQLISENVNALDTIEEIVHPLVSSNRSDFIAQHDGPLLVFDIPLLYETGAESSLDAVLVVSAPPEVQRARVLARPGMTEERFAQMLTRQTPDAEKRRRADYLIETIDLDSARAAVMELIDQLGNDRKNA